MSNQDIVECLSGIKCIYTYAHTYPLWFLSIKESCALTVISGCNDLYWSLYYIFSPLIDRWTPYYTILTHDLLLIPTVLVMAL
jgi:hypothetical protein